MKTIYVFECNDNTQLECFQHNLFGSNSKWPLNVNTGDLYLLFNYYSKKQLIYGVFQAICKGQLNIVKDAWDGKYPYQVKVKRCSKELIVVPRCNIDRFVTNSKTLRVRNQIIGDNAEELLQYFAGGYTSLIQQGKKMNEFEEDYRMKFPRNYHCSDGHNVRSLSEQAIDEWLSSHHIYHEYERLTSIPENLIPDFTVYNVDKSPVFIEYWGMLDDQVYQKRRLLKCEAYYKHRCKLIELYQDDIRNIDFSLRKKLLEYNVEVK